MDEDDGKDNVRFVRSRALPGVELLLAENNTHHWHVFHEQYAICTCDTAAAYFKYRQGSYALGDRGTMLLEPGETHDTYKVGKPSDFQVVFFTPELMQRFSRELGICGTPHFSAAQANGTQFYNAYKHLYAAILNGATEMEQQSWLAACVQTLLTGYAEKRPPKPLHQPDQLALQHARDYLHAHCEESLSLDELASIAGLTRFHFLRAFSTRFGMPPHTYHLRVRIERSRALLRHGMKASTVASLMGFADQSHYIRHFKRALGVTPAQYQAG